MSDAVRFFVPGVPAPGGSKKSWAHPRTGKIITVDDAKRNGPWRSVCTLHAGVAVRDAGLSPLVPPPGGCLRLVVAFFMPRPKYHFRSGKRAGELKPGAALAHTGKPDATKLLRALEDALTGVVWEDDARVASQCVGKWYATPGGPHDKPGAAVLVTAIGPDEAARRMGAMLAEIEGAANQRRGS